MESPPSKCEGISTIIKKAWLPTFGALWHPAYTIINAAYCGRIGDTELAGFGLGSLTLGIVAIAVSNSFCLTLATPVSQSSGAGDKRMCRVYLNRQYYLNTLIFPFICLPLIFIKQIYTFIG